MTRSRNHAPRTGNRLQKGVLAIGLASAALAGCSSSAEAPKPTVPVTKKVEVGAPTVSSPEVTSDREQLERATVMVAGVAVDMVDILDDPRNVSTEEYDGTSLGNKDAGHRYSGSPETIVSFVDGNIYVVAAQGYDTNTGKAVPGKYGTLSEAEQKKTGIDWDSSTFFCTLKVTEGNPILSSNYAVNADTLRQALTDGHLELKSCEGQYLDFDREGRGDKAISKHFSVEVVNGKVIAKTNPNAYASDLHAKENMQPVQDPADALRIAQAATSQWKREMDTPNLFPLS